MTREASNANDTNQGRTLGSGSAIWFERSCYSNCMLSREILRGTIRNPASDPYKYGMECKFLISSQL